MVVDGAARAWHLHPNPTGGEGQISGMAPILCRHTHDYSLPGMCSGLGTGFLSYHVIEVTIYVEGLWERFVFIVQRGNFPCFYSLHVFYKVNLLQYYPQAFCLGFCI